MKLVVYQGNKRRGNKPFCQTDFTLKWSALPWLFAGKDWKSGRGHSYWRDHQGCFQVWKVNNYKLKNASEWTLTLPSKQSQTMPEFQIQKRNAFFNKARVFIFLFLCYHPINGIIIVVVLIFILKSQGKVQEEKDGLEEILKNHSSRWITIPYQSIL